MASQGRRGGIFTAGQFNKAGGYSGATSMYMSCQPTAGQMEAVAFVKAFSIKKENRTDLAEWCNVLNVKCAVKASSSGRLSYLRKAFGYLSCNSF